MESSRDSVLKILRRLDDCLRHSYGIVRPALQSLRHQTWTTMLPALLQPTQDTPAMIVSCRWRKRLDVFAMRSLDFAWVAVVYLASELVVWGLSRCLAPVHVQFFASILGMLLVFALMAVAYLLLPRCDEIYQRHIKSKVDFINAHMGLGFPIPLVMLNQSDILGGREIARIIGNFVITNVISWTTVFALSFLIMAATAKLRSLRDESPQQDNPPPSTTLQMALPWPSNTSLTCAGSDREMSIQSNSLGHDTERSEATIRTSSCDLTPEYDDDRSAWWRFGADNFSSLASLLGALVIGVPIAAVKGENRILDGCVLWFIWIGSVRVQRFFNSPRSFLGHAPKLNNAISTLLNPVLATTLLMTAYTRVKAVTTSAMNLDQVLKMFSSGTPLYTLWTFAVTKKPLPEGMRDWFGAGDAALSILECGILIWGFKLYECRRQLFSIAGLWTVLISIAAAAGNVFLSVLSGRTMGLATAESLAFAARSTTLALAKPAMVAVGGNLGANAALVVSNGILGQLMYPYALGKLEVKGRRGEADEGSLSSSSKTYGSDGTVNSCRNATIIRAHEYGSEEKRTVLVGEDDPITIAAGITIGINGAAMGVAYLYETKSRAAPYAALAMTVFGVMTVLFTTVEPFKGVVVSLAS